MAKIPSMPFRTEGNTGEQALHPTAVECQFSHDAACHQPPR
jgi:hypothetical protein